MSDFPPPAPSGPASGSPGPGWWQASDGNWYPPQQQSGVPQQPAYGQPAYGQPAYGYQVAATQKTNGLAIASLVCGCLFFIYFIPSILALVFGYIAKGQIDRSNGAEGGRGMAIAGIILGWIGVAFMVLFLIIFVALVDNTNDFDFESDFGLGGALQLAALR